MYNHHDRINEIVRYVDSLGMHSVVVNDGSNKECTDILNFLPSKFKRVKLITLDKNYGKGFAVIHGLKIAKNLGYTHALQIDADGQYPLEYISQFIRKAKEKPDSIISGNRAYEMMPLKRRWGRRFTDFWVIVHTWSISIKDSMCGIRLYPLEAVYALIKTIKIRNRMDFDTDIIVRLYWFGVVVEHIKVDVKYDEEIVSHFHFIKDNYRMTIMHIRLFFCMLYRVFTFTHFRFHK